MVKARKTMRRKIMMEINQNKEGTRIRKARNAMKKTRRKMRRDPSWTTAVTRFPCL